MGILVHADKCTGCRCCELACYFARTDTFNPKKARIDVVSLDYIGFSNPVVCLLCKQPRCVEVCPVGALSQTEEGVIQVDEAACDGCKICVDECIVGAINFDEAAGLPLICDLCGGKPACIEWCPSGALTPSSVKKRKRRKALSYTLSKAKPFINKWKIPENALDWYQKYT